MMWHRSVLMICFLPEGCMDLVKSSKAENFRQKSIWIDVLLIPQGEIVDGSDDTPNIITQTADRVGSTHINILFIDTYFFLRAWCLLQLATSMQKKYVANILICAPRTSSKRKLLLHEWENPFRDMKSSLHQDLVLIRKAIIARFVTPEQFNTAIKQAFVLVKSTILFDEANRLRVGKPQPGKGAGLAKNCQNDYKALALYEKSAELGHAEAIYRVGCFHEQGRGGLTKDDARAVEKYRDAADKGCAAAQAVLGRRCEFGQGIPGKKKNDVEAARWYKLAADQGDAAAQCDLAEFYEEGKGGLSRDPGKAAELYRLSAAQRYVRAEEKVRNLPPPEVKRGTFLRRLGATFLRR
jgi:hypothetical protein